MGGIKEPKNLSSLFYLYLLERNFFMFLPGIVESFMRNEKGMKQRIIEVKEISNL